MAPFAAAYPSEGTHDGPVHVRLGDGAEDKLMDWAASEISVLRTQTPAAQQLQEMDWDVWEGEAQNEGTLVVIGELVHRASRRRLSWDRHKLPPGTAASVASAARPPGSLFPPLSTDTLHPSNRPLRARLAQEVDSQR